MKRINLLPDTYLAARRRRRSGRRWCAAAVVVSLFCGTWALLAWRQVAALSAEIAATQRQVDQGRLRLEELEQIQNDSRRLESLLAVPAGVHTSVPATGLLALFSDLLPESTVLTRMLIEMPPPVLAPLSDAAARAGTARAPEPELRPIRIELEGLALSSADVARTMSALSHHRLFSNVTLTRSRGVNVLGASRIAFHMALTVNPRAAVASATGEEGTADAR